MPKIRVPSTQTEIEMQFGEKLISLVETGAIPVRLKCRAGACGSCSIEILHKPENLSPLSKSEERYFKLFPSDKSLRLACQCKVLGDVVIDRPDSQT